MFEAQDRPGGMMVLGIPPYRLRREVLQDEIRAILDMGVELRTGQALGRDFSLGSLKDEGFASVFLGIGCMRGRDLSIPGAGLDGVLRAVDFLLNANLGYRVELGDDVVVIGGGNVALDAARTALREIAAGRSTTDPFAEADQELEGAVTQTLDVARVAKRLGARRVRVVALESREEMPAHEFEIEETEVEGIEVLTRLGPKAILGNGHVSGLETLQVASVFDPDGRFNPRLIDGTESVLECDSVIMAIGQAPDLSWLSEDDGVELSPRGTIAVDRESLATSADWIYAGGDVAFGPRNLIDAIGDGRRAAASIHRADRGRGPADAFPRDAQAPPDRRGPRSDVRLHRVPAGADPGGALGAADRIAGGRAGVHAGGGSRGSLALSAVLPEHHARAVDLHPVRRLRRHLPREVHPHHPDGGHHRRRAGPRRSRERTDHPGRPVHPVRALRRPVSHGCVVPAGVVGIIDRSDRARTDRKLRSNHGV